ncbi:hypothetical protein LWI29_017978 [Acer saccharum]|uniref:Uncharacterized protein n=1 Tax=Acer saccharum TaxID=4024 RepID=A0AA39W6K0_ACESA|nr:hypothetical protein LWI29_017978 [Acer saccharum]
MSNESLSNSQFIGKAKEINVVKDIHNCGMNNVQSKMEGTIKGFSDGKAEMISKIEMLDEVMVGECAESRNANESLDLFDRSPLDTIACDSVHFAEPMNDYCAGKNYKTVPKHKPNLPKEGGVANCGNNAQEKLVDCFDVVKYAEGNNKIEQLISENFTQQMVEEIDLEVVNEVHVDPTNLVVEEIDKTIESNIFEGFVLMSYVLIGQIVSTLGFGFENVKTKGMSYGETSQLESTTPTSQIGDFAPLSFY